jgi:hypothetical protein
VSKSGYRAKPSQFSHWWFILELFTHRNIFMIINRKKEKFQGTTIEKRMGAPWPWHPALEFLTDWTSCTNEMLKRTTSEKFCQKRPPLSGGTSGQATRGTCRLGRRRHGGAATANAGMWPGSPLRSSPFFSVGPAASPVSGMLTWHLPPMVAPARCHARPA